jgi:hypothetical protein
MSSLVRIPLGILVVVIGFLLVWKTEPVFRFTGTVDWAEEKIGPGQTRLFIKLVGLGTAFVGMFMATGIASDILTAFAGLFARKR